jgi:hypothetical protein
MLLYLNYSIVVGISHNYCLIDVRIAKSILVPKSKRNIGRAIKIIAVDDSGTRATKDMNKRERKTQGRRRHRWKIICQNDTIISCSLCIRIIQNAFSRWFYPNQQQKVSQNCH